MPDEYGRRTFSEINDYLGGKISVMKGDFYVFGEHGLDNKGNPVIFYSPKMFDLGQGASPFSGDPNRKLTLGAMERDPNLPIDEITSVRWNDPETRHLRVSDDEPRYHCLNILVHAAPGGPEGMGCGKFLDRKLFKEYEYNQIKNEKQDDNSRLFKKIKYDETMSYENKLELMDVLQKEDPEYLSTYVKASLPELKEVLEIEGKRLEEDTEGAESERMLKAEAERFCVGPGGICERKFELPEEPGEGYYRIYTDQQDPYLKYPDEDVLHMLADEENLELPAYPNPVNVQALPKTRREALVGKRPTGTFAQALPPPPGYFVVSPPPPTPAAISLSYAAGLQGQGQDNPLQYELPMGQRVKRRPRMKKRPKTSKKKRPNVRKKKRSKTHKKIRKRTRKNK